jgi:hypothetical protein
MKKSKKNSILEQVKAIKKRNRTEEIKLHGKAINYNKIMENKKKYNRKRNKLEDDL